MEVAFRAAAERRLVGALDMRRWRVCRRAGGCLVRSDLGPVQSHRNWRLRAASLGDRRVSGGDMLRTCECGARHPLSTEPKLASSRYKAAGWGTGMANTARLLTLGVVRSRRAPSTTMERPSVMPLTGTAPLMV